MIRLMCVALAAALLAGCHGDAINSAGTTICRHQDGARAALELALVAAQAKDDPVKREAAIGAVRIAIAALDQCPPASSAGT